MIVLDAKRGQIFTARYRRSDATQPWQEAEPARLDTLAAMLTRAGRPVYLIGEGIPYHRQPITASADVIVTDEATWRARAATVSQLGAAMAQAGLFTDAAALVPLYVRLPEAEEKRLIAEGLLRAVNAG